VTDLESKLPRGRAILPAEVHVHFDGACQPPLGGGVATYGFTVEGPGLHYDEKGLAVPPWTPRATNNVAEYTGAIRALEWLREKGYSGPLRVMGDSQLVIRQVQGQYRVKAPHLVTYHARLLRLAAQFEQVDWVWIPREANARADELSKEALDDEWRRAARYRPSAPVVPEAEDEDSPDDTSPAPRTKGS
jgi:ribonuclease HI